jgi:hypothetical protein
VFSKSSKQDWRSSGVGLIDLGHVFTALDAFYNPVPSRVARYVFHFKDSKGPASWSGDVGSVLIAYWSHEKAKKEHFRKRMGNIYSKYASTSDINGDVDGLAMGHLYQKKGLKLSQMLTRYFLKSEFKQHRFSAFARGELGSVNLGGQAFAAKVREAVVLFAKAYYKKTKSG